MYSYSSKKWDQNIFVFVFAKPFQHEYICICICQKMLTQLYLYSYWGLTIVFVTHWSRKYYVAWLTPFVFIHKLKIQFYRCISHTIKRCDSTFPGKTLAVLGKHLGFFGNIFDYNLSYFVAYNILLQIPQFCIAKLQQKNRHSEVKRQIDLLNVTEDYLKHQKGNKLILMNF